MPGASQESWAIESFSFGAQTLQPEGSSPSQNGVHTEVAQRWGVGTEVPYPALASGSPVPQKAQALWEAATAQQEALKYPSLGDTFQQPSVLPGSELFLISDLLPSSWSWNVFSLALSQIESFTKVCRLHFLKALGLCRETDRKPGSAAYYWCNLGKCCNHSNLCSAIDSWCDLRQIP